MLKTQALALGRKLALPWGPETEKAIHRDMHPALTHEYQPPETSKRETSHRHRALAPSSRSWATFDSF